MTKLQHISWTAILLILSSSSIDSSHATTISNISRKVESTAITIETNQLAQAQENDDEMLDTLQQREGKLDELSTDKVEKSSKPESKSSLTPTLMMLVIGLPTTITVLLIGTPIVKGVTEILKNKYQAKFGKPPVPEGSVNLHGRYFKELTSIGMKAEKINNEKFGSQEFLLLVRIKISMAKEAEGYRGLGNCVDLLQAGIIAQKSFMRLEQTEIRYRSRKQQEFYRYVAENLQGEIDKEAFIEKIQQKQTEIVPLITTEEGKDAIDAYTKELNVLGQYKLGLKLLALFHQYELKDFSILKKIADVVETFKSKDLVNSDDLISPVLENYESFEKLSPIIGLSVAESTPQAYAKILQVIGLTNRHGKAYLEFDQLVQLLKKWETAYKAIALVRQEYIESKYDIPAEFKQDPPGWNIYQRYAEYLPDL